MPLLPQRYLEAPRTITAFVDPEDLDQRRFPGRYLLSHYLLLRLLSSVVATG